MYYIVNQTDHIIAADSDLLTLLSVSSLDDLHKDIALGNIEFTMPFGSDLNITLAGEARSYLSERHTLSSLLGDMTLVEVKEEIVEEQEAEKAEENLAEDKFDEEEPADDEDIITYSDEISLIEDEPLAPTEEEESQEEEEPIISLLEEEAPLDLIEEESEENESPEPEQDLDDTPIFIDVAEVSRKIGISTDDYERFLKEYIDTALTLEDDLNGKHEKQKNQAITTLSHLSNVLHLDAISKTIEKIKDADEKEQHSYILDFYNLLARVSTEKEERTAVEEEATQVPADKHKRLGTIDLSDVKPIHFDFQMSEAAKDLSLPIELIEEFVIDFIEQAHVETENMLKAYEKGDISTVQKLGHLLKGTSSNLRIKPLADTLYAIQFSDENDDLEALIKNYWGHFLSFENQINATLKRI